MLLHNKNVYLIVSNMWGFLSMYCILCILRASDSMLFSKKLTSIPFHFRSIVPTSLRGHTQPRSISHPNENLIGVIGKGQKSPPQADLHDSWESHFQVRKAGKNRLAGFNFSLLAQNRFTLILMPPWQKLDHLKWITWLSLSRPA